MTTTDNALCCGRGHASQRQDYPRGARVRTISAITPDIPSGTNGTVTSHCDDGRAWVLFDGYHAGHTFHNPSDYMIIDKLPEVDLHNVGDEFELTSAVEWLSGAIERGLKSTDPNDTALVVDGTAALLSRPDCVCYEGCEEETP